MTTILSVGISQNRHFTYFQLAPLDINPALTGEFQGSIRVSSIIRNQAFGWAANPLVTSNLSLDVNMLNGFTEGDWISFGLSYDAFEAGGIVKFKRAIYKPGAAYHYSYGKKQNSTLTLGIQYGGVQERVDFTGDGILTAVSLANGSDPLADADLQERINQGEADNVGISDGSSGDLLVGLTWKTKFAKTNHFLAGFAVGNILNPGKGLANVSGAGGSGGGIATNAELPLLYRGFAEMRTLINKRTAFIPTVFYQKQGAASEFQMNAMLDYLVKPDMGLVIRGGLGARIASASDAQLLLGADYKGFKIGASFDLGISGVSGVDNAYEVGLGYIYNIFKKPTVKPIIICPRL